MLMFASIKPRVIGFSVPGIKHYENDYHQNNPSSFAAFSVTGNKCSLHCSHCNGILLYVVNMYSVYAVYVVCCMLHMLYAVYDVCAVYCISCICSMLYAVSCI